MRPVNIQLSSPGIAMPILLIFSILFHPHLSNSQTCASTQGSVTYDTVFSGTNAIAFATLNIGRLDPAKKMIYAVVAQSSFTIDLGSSGNSVQFIDTSNSNVSAPQAQATGSYVWFPTGPAFSQFIGNIDPLLDPVTNLPY